MSIGQYKVKLQRRFKQTYCRFTNVKIYKMFVFVRYKSFKVAADKTVPSRAILRYNDNVRKYLILQIFNG